MACNNLIPKVPLVFFIKSFYVLRTGLAHQDSFYCTRLPFFTNDRRAHAKPEHRSLVVITWSMHGIMMLFSTD